MVDAEYQRLYGGPSSGIGSALLGSFSGTGAAAFGMAGSAMSAAAGALGPFGVAALAATGGLVLLNRQINNLADSYAQYSPAIATAQAFAEMRQIMNDMRRANTMGSQIANYIDTQSKLDQSWQDFMLNLVTTFGPGLNEILKILTDILKLITGARDDQQLGEMTGLAAEPRSIFVPNL
jgi:hypothetical protein